jgi:hypothetical protein
LEVKFQLWKELRLYGAVDTRAKLGAVAFSTSNVNAKSAMHAQRRKSLSVIRIVVVHWWVAYREI